ncbi:hypothetical protein MY4038_009303 [Beauveria bassiana]
MLREKTRAPKLRTRDAPSTASRPSEEPRSLAARDLGNILLCKGQHINGRIGLSLGSHVSEFPKSEERGNANAEMLSSSEPSVIGLIDNMHCLMFPHAATVKQKSGSSNAKKQRDTHRPTDG